MSRALLPAVAVLCLVSGAPAGAQMLPPGDIPSSTGYGAPFPEDDDYGMAPSYPVMPEAGYGRRLPPLYREPEPPAPVGTYAPRPAMPHGDMPASTSRLPEDYRFARPQGAEPVYRPPGEVTASPEAGRFASLPPDYRPEEAAGELDPRFRRQVVPYRTAEPAGTIVVDTANTYLYYVLGNGQAMRYGIGVGREGFTWTGRERVSRMAEWPDWHPPSQMLERQPDLPRFMAGGEGNPLGARALYLGKTLYRIHGTNQPSTIGTFVSSGCIRMLNADVIDLFNRVKVGTQVVVLPGRPSRSVSLPGASAR